MSRVDHELKEAQLWQQAVAVEVRGPSDGQDSKLQEPRGEATEYVCDHFRWSLRDPSAPGPRSLPLDYHGLCPHFDLEVAKQYARDSNTPEMVQIIFYTMAYHGLRDMGHAKVELGPSGSIAPGQCPKAPTSLGHSSSQSLDKPRAEEYVTDNLRWSAKETFSIRPNLLPLHFTAYCPEFDHIVAMQFAHAAHVPEMGQAIFMPW
ncbi:hypothetical protein Cgig2_008751 [Carnegiea gigantea]|uniref:Uncharacterized protein n=1 Tax=Carnegiea gigantea TaxID=171969 RepID=A0A9Q1GRE8_9CARY|nr:hypothetical protein Cgig2_008751 [Carnegiea gigantea]